MNAKLLAAYKKFRSNPMYFVGRNAEMALSSARTLVEFEELESKGVVRMRAEIDDDADISWMDERQLKEFRDRWNSEAYGTIAEYLDPKTNEWETAISVWGHIGYQNVLDPLENCYVIDEMAAAIKAYKDAISQFRFYQCPECKSDDLTFHASDDTFATWNKQKQAWEVEFKPREVCCNDCFALFDFEIAIVRDGNGHTVNQREIQS